MDLPPTDELFDKVIVIDGKHYGLLSQFETDSDLPDYRLFSYEQLESEFEFTREELEEIVSENGTILDSPQYIDYAIEHTRKQKIHLNKASQNKSQGQISKAREHLHKAEKHRDKVRQYSKDSSLN